MTTIKKSSRSATAERHLHKVDSLIYNMLTTEETTATTATVNTPSFVISAVRSISSPSISTPPPCRLASKFRPTLLTS